MLILAILAFGMLVGWLAQIVVSGSTTPNAQSLIAGLLGSLVGGTLGSLLSDEGFKLQFSGILGSFVGAVIVVLVWNAIAARK